MEYSKFASGQVISGGTGTSSTVVLPFIPNYIVIENVTRVAAAAGVWMADWNSRMAQNSAILQTLTAGVPTLSFTATGGFSTFSAGVANTYGPAVAITSVTQAAAAVVTAVAHGLVTGDKVLITGTTGMLQIAGVAYTVTVTGANTFTIPVNSSGFAAPATAGSMKKLTAPYLFYPGDEVITGITPGVTTTVTTAQTHNYVVGQQVEFHIPATWGTVGTVLNGEVGTIPPTTWFITSIPSANSFVVAANTTGLTFVYPTSAQYAGGITPAQVVAVGDNRTGAIVSAEPFPPMTTINAPTIAGAFVNNSRQGFVIGSALIGTAADVIFWRAQAYDLVL